MATSDPIQFTHEPRTYLPDGSLDESTNELSSGARGRVCCVFFFDAQAGDGACFELSLTTDTREVRADVRAGRGAMAFASGPTNNPKSNDKTPYVLIGLTSSTACPC